MRTTKRFLVKVKLDISMSDFGLKTVKEEIFETKGHNLFSIPDLTNYKGAENGSVISFEVIGEREYKVSRNSPLQLIKEVIYKN